MHSAQRYRVSGSEKYRLGHLRIPFPPPLPEIVGSRPSTGIGISTGDHLKLHVTVLATLSFVARGASHALTTSRPPKPFAGEAMIPRGMGDGSTLRVPLLKERRLAWGCRHVFRLLHQLEYPDALGQVDQATTGRSAVTE